MPSFAIQLLLILSIVDLSTSQFLTYTGSARAVFGQKGFQDALWDQSVNIIRIGGKVQLTSQWQRPGTIVDRQLLIEGDPNNSTHTLDFGGLISAVVFGNNTEVVFQNVSIQGAGHQSITDQDLQNYPTVANRVTALGVWPSLIFLDGSDVVFNNTNLQYYSQQSWSQCQYFSQKVLFQLQADGIGGNVSAPNGVTLQLQGSYNATSNITYYNTSNQTLGQVGLTTTNTTMVCVNDPYSGGSRATGGGFKWWYGLIIAVGVVLLLSVVSLGLFVWLVRRRKRSNAAQTSLGSSKSPPSQGLLPTDSASVISSPADRTSQTHLTADAMSVVAVASGVHGVSPKLSYFGSLNSVNSHSSHGGSVPNGMQTPSSTLGRISSWDEVQNLLRERTDFSDLEFGPLIGKGSFGRVYKGRWKGAFVAVKVVDHKEAANKVIALREGTLSHSAQHPNIITTYNVFTQEVPMGSDAAWMQDSHVTETRPEDEVGSRQQSMDAGPSDSHWSTVLILEYADRGTLDKAVTTGRFVNSVTGEINLRAIHATLLDIAGGIAYLHSVGVLHGDLKGANVLLKSTTADSRGFTAKLADFGMARLLAENSTHVSTKTYGTISYMPIEVLKHGKLTRAVDSYSFAIIMWELFSGQVLYADMTVAQLYYKVCCENDKPPVPAHMPLEYSQLMQQCWVDDAEQRPTSEEILQYLMTLPAHRRVSKESQAASGSIPSPGKLPTRSTSKSAPFSHKEAPARSSKAANTGKSRKSISKRDSAEGPGSMKAIPPENEQARLSLSMELPEGMAEVALRAEKKQQNNADQPSPAPGQEPHPHKVAASPFSINNTVARPQRVQTSPFQNSQPVSRELRPDQPPADNDIQPSPLSEQKPALTSKQPPNPFGQVAMQFVKDENSAAEPFGVKRVS